MGYSDFNYSFIAPNGARVSVKNWSSFLVRNTELAKTVVFNDRELFAKESR